MTGSSESVRLKQHDARGRLLDCTEHPTGYTPINGSLYLAFLTPNSFQLEKEAIEPKQNGSGIRVTHEILLEPHGIKRAAKVCCYSYHALMNFTG